LIGVYLVQTARSSLPADRCGSRFVLFFLIGDEESRGADLEDGHVIDDITPTHLLFLTV
jgi:hypothetical protein